MPDESTEAEQARLTGCPKCRRTLDRLTEPDGLRYACGACSSFYDYLTPIPLDWATRGNAQ